MFGHYPRNVWIGLMLIGLLVVYVTLDSRLVKGQDAYAAVSRSIDEYAEVVKLLSQSYFKSLEVEELTASAIEGMLRDLDPYTQYLGPKALEQLRIETRGKFGGLGITISLRGGDVPVVMSVFEGTPADTSGLVVGDKIMKIEGEPTAGKTLQEVVDVLRGTPGKEVTITIDRYGRQALFDQSIIRARISIETVRVAEEVEPGIGYISMTGLLNSRFSETTPRELDRALRKLKDQNVGGIILDLRGNPGGLLNQAVAVVDKFLGKGQLVVTTKGRMPTQNEAYRTEEKSLVKDIPLVVLVNRHSASASEIVAGALQDSDRGLILGTTTFGKGSVQTVRQIGRNKALKLTTAIYYTPSGRSIHKSSRQAQSGRGMALAIEDTLRIPVYQVVGLIGETDRREDALAELQERFGLSREQAAQVMDTRLDQLVGLGLRDEVKGPKGDDPKKVFKTVGGRTVHGGGGITPDVEVKPTKRPRLVLALLRAGLFFDFGVHYAVNRSFPGRPEDYRLDEGIVATFRAFLSDTANTRGLGFYHQSPSEVRLQALEEALAEAGLHDEVEKNLLERLREVAKQEREVAFKKAEPYIRLEIERELANRVWGDRTKLLTSLKGDKQFQEAVRILKDPELYRKKMNLTLASRE